MSSQADQLVSLQRQILAQLVAIHQQAKVTTLELQSKKRLLSLGFAWALYLVVNTGAAGVNWYNDTANSWAGKILGLPPLKEAPIQSQADQPLQKGDHVAGYPVTSGYGHRPAPCKGCSRYHQGVDIGTPTGTPVVMPWPGRVACSWSNGAGNVATLEADSGQVVKLLHLASCKDGRHGKGAKIAATGATGLGTGPHLDIRVYQAGQPVPPGRQVVASLLGGGDASALREAIVGKESGGKPDAVNPHSGALGLGQVMPENLPSWSKAAVGRVVTQEEYLADPGLQKRIIDHKLTSYYQEELAKTGGDRDTAVRRVASRWYSGRPDLYQDRRPQSYGAGRYPSIDSYTTDILKRYKEAE